MQLRSAAIRNTAVKKVEFLASPYSERWPGANERRGSPTLTHAPRRENPTHAFACREKIGRVAYYYLKRQAHALAIPPRRNKINEQTPTEYGVTSASKWMPARLMPFGPFSLLHAGTYEAYLAPLAPLPTNDSITMDVGS